MTKDEAQDLFFADISRHFDLWVKWMLDTATDPSVDLKPWKECETDFRILQQALNDAEKQTALRSLLRIGLSGLLDSVMLTFDGATELADHVSVEIRTSGGHELGPALNEFFFEYLYKTNRLP